MRIEPATNLTSAAISRRVQAAKKMICRSETPSIPRWPWGRTLMMTLRTRKNSLISIALFAVAGPALAQDAMKVTYVTPDALTWKDNPTMPKGAQTRVWSAKAGETSTARTKFPPNYQVPAHTHPYTESVTIISGSVYLGEGEKLDTQKGTLLKASSYFLKSAE